MSQRAWRRGGKGVLVYRSAVILIMGALLAAVLLLVCLHMLAVVELLAVVDEQAGTVHVVRGAQAQRAAVGMLVRAGECIRTGADSHVGLHWADGSRIEVGPNSEVVVQRCRLHKVRKSRYTHFRLNLGEIWIRLRGTLRPGSKFEVETPTIVAAVRGTIFNIKVSRDGTTRLQVYQGEVQIVGDGAAQGVLAGKCATVGKGRFELQSMSEADAARWRAAADIIGPLLELREPAQGITTSVALAPVYGRTEDAATVTVNGEPVAVNRKGMFRTRARLTQGPNVITVTATLGQLRTTLRREVTYVNPTRVLVLTCRPSSEPRAPAGTMEVTAVARDDAGELVADGTPVQFFADRGRIVRYHRTERGAVSATWTPPAAGEGARVTATSGRARATIIIPAAAPATAPGR